jgi:hypothetical protein
MTQLITATRHAEAQSAWVAEERLGDLAFAATAAGGASWLAPVAELKRAEILFGAGAVDEGLAAFEHAIELGFDDPIELAWVLPTSLRAHPRIVAAWKRVRVAPVDRREQDWLRQETQATFHDGTLMTIANMNRRDGELTQITPPTVPTRLTRSIAVIAGRERLRNALVQQQAKVLASDQSRMNHLISMGMFGPPVSPSEQLHSLQMAKIARDARNEGIRERGRLLKDSASAEPQSLAALDPEAPAIEGVPTIPAKALTRPVSEPDGSNPLGACVVGDTLTYEITYLDKTSGETLGQQIATHKVLANAEGRVAVRVQFGSGKEAEVSFEASTIQPTLREQIVADLRVDGPVEVLSYDEKVITHTRDGREVPARRITMGFTWHREGEEKPEAYELTQVVGQSAPSYGVLEATLIMPTLTFQMRLKRFEPGKAK